MANTFILEMQLGDIREYDNVALNLAALVAHRGDGLEREKRLAILAAFPELTLPSASETQFLCDGAIEIVVMSVGFEKPRQLADRFGGRVTGYFGEGTID